MEGGVGSRMLGRGSCGRPHHSAADQEEGSMCSQSPEMPGCDMSDCPGTHAPIAAAMKGAGLGNIRQPLSRAACPVAAAAAAAPAAAAAAGRPVTHLRAAGHWQPAPTQFASCEWPWCSMKSGAGPSAAAARDSRLHARGRAWGGGTEA